ncbi:MAG: hypothetical protein IPM16_17930 [Chloroflexi bacterium]|nr:hypothetical protein [Chloroflexota bacterium]
MTRWTRRFRTNSSRNSASRIPYTCCRDSRDLNPRERRHDISTFNKKLRALNRTVKDRDKQKAKVEKIQARLTALQNEVTQLTQNVQDNDDQAKDLKTESDQLLETVKSYKERGVALGVVDRKLGNALKGVNIAGSIVGLIGSGVGIAGLILAGTAAAAVLGPVGWAIGGLLLAVGVGVLIGTAVKKKIRANNVKRMRSEKGLIETFIATGKVNGAVPSQYPAADTKSVDDRKALQWQRAAFPTTPSKKASKSDPNQTMEARLNYITEYLGKYDVEAAGDAIWYGVLDAFHGTEGQQDVPNPKHTEWENLSEAKRKKKPEPPKNIKLKTQISNLINDLDPKNANKIIADINTVGKQWYEGQQKDPQEDLTDQGEIKRFNAAKRLVLKKLKVG